MIDCAERNFSSPNGMLTTIMYSRRSKTLWRISRLCAQFVFFCAGARPSAITVHAAHASAVRAEAVPESTPPFPLRAARLSRSIFVRKEIGNVDN